jgi:hypothetical protein
MINKKAWSVVEMFLPTHFLGSTGPCCDRCSLMLAAVNEAIRREEADANAKESRAFGIIKRAMRGTLTPEDHYILSSLNPKPCLFGGTEPDDRTTGFRKN